MRISPLGIFGATRDRELVARWGQEDAALTHIHPVCKEINALFTLAIREAVREPISPTELFERIDTWARARNAPCEVLLTIRTSRTNPPSNYSQLQGWVLTAFGNALWQLLHAPDLEHGVIDTVRRGGDTDTNGAIAGALLGAVHGRKAIPPRWEQKILSCRPDFGVEGVANPRPECFWPTDALELAQALVQPGRPEPSFVAWCLRKRC
jgi:ADP-ribosylglycohydrolase